jgi:hypothetical protein
MINKEIKTFCEKNYACRSGRDWGEENCADMAQVWETARPLWLVWIATREGVMNARQQRRFACWAVRQIWHLLPDPRSRAAVECAERYADGLVTEAELESARSAAWGAAWTAAPAVVEASEAAREAQSRWLRDNVPNPFKNQQLTPRGTP